MTQASAASKLKDPSLLKTGCYVNGQWVEAKSGKVFSVDSEPSPSQPLTPGFNLFVGPFLQQQTSLMHLNRSLNRRRGGQVPRV